MKYKSAFEIIAEIVCVRRRFTVAEVRSSARTKRVCRVRFEIYWLARDLTDLSYGEIGKAMGGRDHTSVIDGINTQNKRIEREPFYVKEFEEMRGDVAKALMPRNVQPDLLCDETDGLQIARKILIPGNFERGIGPQEIFALAQAVIDREERLANHRKFADFIQSNLDQLT